MTDEPAASEDATPITEGMAVYDDDGAALGVVDGFTAAGFEVDIDPESGEGAGSLDVEDLELDGETVESADIDDRIEDQREQVPGKEFGEGYLQWRCDDCGQVGNLDDGLPTSCPNCGSDAVYRKRED